MRTATCLWVGFCFGLAALAAGAAPPVTEVVDMGGHGLPGAPPDGPHERAAQLPPAPRDLPRVTRPARSAVELTRNNYTSVQVNVDGEGNNIVGDAANEPSIAVDPTNPNRLVIGWRQFDTITSDFREAGWAYSHSAGRAWTFPGVLEEDVFRSDPVLNVGPDGTFYYYSLNYDGSDYTCQMFISYDHGASWVGPIDAHGGDKAWFDVDRTGGVGRGNLYAAWDYAGCCGDNWFTRSIDDGLSYMTPIAIPQQPNWGTVAVHPNGDVFIAGRHDFSYTQFSCVRSSSAKWALGSVQFEFQTFVDLGGALVYYAPNSPNPAGLAGQVWIACDHSDGPTHGNVYMLCSVDPPGADPLDVHFVRSTDGGETWSAPLRLNDDVGTAAWQWFGTLSVAPNGRLDVIWNDTRNGESIRWSEVYYTYSTDGGLTWSPNVAVSPPFDSWLGWPQQEKLGDYYHMVSDNVGASLAYAATFNGEQDVYFLRLGPYDCNGNGVPDGEDVAAGTSSDLNGNGIPDECECFGDVNCDRVVDYADIDPFVAALSCVGGEPTCWPPVGVPEGCAWLRADCNGDGDVTYADIDRFVVRIGAVCP